VFEKKKMTAMLSSPSSMASVAEKKKKMIATIVAFF